MLGTVPNTYGFPVAPAEISVPDELSAMKYTVLGTSVDILKDDAVNNVNPVRFEPFCEYE